MAAASDAKLAKGEGGALEGVPLGIKDLFATEGVHTQACSHVLDGFKPRYESTVTSNLWADGAVMLGKLNMDEFAMGSSNETSYYGPVVNPWRRSRLDQVVMPTTHRATAGLCRLAARRPRARWTISSLCRAARRAARRRPCRPFCAPARRRPTPAARSASRRPSPARSASSRPTAACSRWGIVAFASSLDQAGPIARDVRDAAILLKSMASVDPKDTTSVDRPVPDYEAAIGKSLKGLKVGIPKEYRMDGMPEEIEALWQKGIAWLKDAGAEIVDISLPHTKYALPAYYIVAPAEASSNLARYDGVRYGLRVPGKDIIDMYEKTRAAGFGREVKRRIMIGTYVLSAGYYDAYYLQAQKVRTLIKRDFETCLCRRHRRDPDAGDAERRLRRRRPGHERRPGEDVSERHLHRDGEHGRPAGHRRAGGARRTRDCRWACSSSAGRSTRRRCSRWAR